MKSEHVTHWIKCETLMYEDDNTLSINKIGVLCKSLFKMSHLFQCFIVINCEI